MNFHRSKWLAATLALAVATSFGCGGAKESVTAKAPAAVSADQIDADPVALLPGSPLAVAYVDGRSLLSTPYGEALGRLGDRAVPSGDETGFLPSRDVDSIWSASYVTQGIDGLSVLRGKFDEQKLASAVEKRTTVRGSPVVKSSYAERNVYTVANVGIVVLTPKTALVGSEPVLRRALDRIRDGKLQRSVPSWMLDTIGTQSALFAAAGDFESQPIPPDLKNQVPLPWLRNVKTARVIGTSENGVRVRGQLAYGSPEDAQAGERGLRGVSTIARAASAFGAVPKLEDLDIKVDGNTVDVSFRVDQTGLVSLINAAQRWL